MSDLRRHPLRRPASAPSITTTCATEDPATSPPHLDLAVPTTQGTTGRSQARI